MDTYPDLVAYGLACGFKVTRVVAVDYKKKKSSGKQVHVKGKAGAKEKGKVARKNSDNASDSEADDSDYYSGDSSDEDDWRQF
jgi:hypothetical protein